MAFESMLIFELLRGEGLAGIATPRVFPVFTYKARVQLILLKTLSNSQIIFPASIPVQPDIDGYLKVPAAPFHDLFVVNQSDIEVQLIRLDR